MDAHNPPSESNSCQVCSGFGYTFTHIQDEKIQQECIACNGHGTILPVTQFKTVTPQYFNTIKVKIKKLNPEAVIPAYAKPGDAGLDFTAIDNGVDTWPKEDPANSYFYREYSTGIAIEVPPGYVGLAFPRSSISQTGLILANCVGVVDSGYRGEVKFRFKVDGAGVILTGMQGVRAYKKGDRIGQLIIVPYPAVEFEEVQELSLSERGASGWGSSGK